MRHRRELSARVIRLTGLNREVFTHLNPGPTFPLPPPQMVSSLLPSLLDFLWQKLAYLIFKHIFMLRSPETITEKTTRFPKNHPAPSRCQFREAAHSALQSLPALGLLKNLTLSQTSRF